MSGCLLDCLTTCWTPLWGGWTSAQAGPLREVAALARAAEGGAALEVELAAARAALAEMEGRLERDLPLVAGGRYDRAVQPADPAVRDFAVKAASAAPGAPSSSRFVASSSAPATAATAMAAVCGTAVNTTSAASASCWQCW